MKSTNKSSWLVYIMLFVFLIGCDANDPEDERGPEPLRPLSQAEMQIIQSDNAFGLNVFSALSAAEPEENIFISPLSISMALGMTLNGADGNTRDQMAATLQKQGLTEDAINASYQSLIDLLSTLDPEVDLNIANSIWYRDGFEVLPAFLEVNRTHFDAEVAALDFNNQASLGIINGWVDEKTNGLIDKIIDQINVEDMMYLINAIYFKGSWTYQFEESKTDDAVFNNKGGGRPLIPLMNLYGTVPYASTDEVKLIDLPYGDSLYSMTVVLPHNSENIDEIAYNMTSATWDSWTEPMEAINLDVFLPRFTLEYEKPLNAILVDLGMEEAFDESKANFSRINANQDLYISKVLHKSLVEVNEEGTEAAAVTSVTVGTTSVDPNAPATFRVDRPFIFAIREQHSRSILFIGKVLNL